MNIYNVSVFVLIRSRRCSKDIPHILCTSFANSSERSARRDDDGGAHHEHDVVRIHMPRVPASPTNVSFSLQDFFGLVHDMQEHHYYPYHVFADPLDMADYPGTVYFRHKNWELEPPVGHNLSSIGLQIRDLLSAAEPCGPTQLPSGDGDNAGDIHTRRYVYILHPNFLRIHYLPYAFVPDACTTP